MLTRASFIPGGVLTLTFRGMGAGQAWRLLSKHGTNYFVLFPYFRKCTVHVDRLPETHLSVGQALISRLLDELNRYRSGGKRGMGLARITKARFTSWYLSIWHPAPNLVMIRPCTGLVTCGTP